MSYYLIKLVKYNKYNTKSIFQRSIEIPFYTFTMVNFIHDFYLNCSKEFNLSLKCLSQS